MADSLLVGAGGTVSTTFYDGETEVEPDSVAVTVTGDDGTVFHAAEAGTIDPVTFEVSFDLSGAAVAEVDRLSVSWVGDFGGTDRTVTTRVDVVGGFHVPLAKIRNLPDLADQVRFPTQLLIDARSWWESKCEEVTGRAWVPRFGRHSFAGDGTTQAILPHWPIQAILSASVNDATVSVADLTVNDIGTLVHASGTFSRPARWGVDNVTVRYRYGYDALPSELEEAALTAIRWKVIQHYESAPSRERFSQADEFGTTRFVLPGKGRPTGIPEVDEVLARYPRSPVVA